jgi:hypothetical protein
MRNIKRDCRGISTLITDIILISIIVAAGFMLMLWTVNYTSEFNKQFSEAMAADIARLKERLAFELVYYNPSQSTLKVYLMNYGTIDNIAIKTVYVYDSTDAPVFSGSVDLKRLDGASTADLDRGEEGFFTLSLSLSYGSYNVRIITGRGSTFERNFIV